ncbi:MAG: enoyl-CoA hydratase/isomerase family protein [Alphaproteobacteria bacterium]|nr:enoyl-CoA hydratase/isomerase family protein [Alphaproteobacteria bacterium]
MSAAGMIEVSRDGPVATVTLSRAAKRNALSSAMIADLGAAFARLSADGDLRAVILHGAGPSFCAGADVAEMAALDETSAETFIRGLHGAIQAVRGCPVPVIAAIRGRCLGAGVELAAGCDLRLAAADARFAMPEVLVGIPSVIEAALLPGLIGRGRAARLLLTGETIDAATAERWGLVEEVVAPPDALNAGPLNADALEDRARALAEAIAAADPRAVRAQKTLMRRWETLPVEAAIEAGVRPFADSYRTAAPRARMAAVLGGKP